jgi:hypothetical protein
MRPIAVVAPLALVLAGCATPAPYGNFVPSGTGDPQKLAGDAVKQLTTLWPPAKTRLELKQATPDAFGAALVKGLRASGYALLEFNPEKTQAPASDSPAPARPPTATATLAQPLRYVLDPVGGTALYRLTLRVGTQSLTRPYLERNGTLVPAGYWVRQE